jgi:hypothetical protein
MEILRAAVVSDGRSGTVDGRSGRYCAYALSSTGGVGPAPQVSMKVSPTEVEINSSFVHGVVTLDGGTTQLCDGRTASAATDAGWLAVTMHRTRPGAAATNVMRDVYLVQGRDLTIWRTLNVQFDDGRDGKIDCGNRHAIVYTRE